MALPICSLCTLVQVAEKAASEGRQRTGGEGGGLKGGGGKKVVCQLIQPPGHLKRGLKGNEEKEGDA